MSDKKTKVRVEVVDTSCGASGHMTVDEIKARALDDEIELACPECGQVHLTKEEAVAAAKQRVVETAEYHKMKEQAEEKYSEFREAVQAAKQRKMEEQAE